MTKKCDIRDAAFWSYIIRIAFFPKDWYSAVGRSILKANNEVSF